MARVAFTPNIQRHVPCPEAQVPGDTVREVLQQVFAANERARSYVLDDQGALREHMLVFVDGRPIADRARQSDSVSEQSEVFVFQALSGG